MPVVYMDHPLIKHKITMLRMDSTKTYEFRKIVEEIAMLMGYEALADLPTVDLPIKSPFEDTVQPVIGGKMLPRSRFVASGYKVPVPVRRGAAGDSSCQDGSKGIS